jgi:ATP-dependent DNA helicase RecG
MSGPGVLPTLAHPIAVLKGVGTRRAGDLTSAGLVTIEDLLLRFPLRYEDRRHPTPLSALRPGGLASVVATIASVALKRTRRPGFTIVEAGLRDGSGTARAVWFNQRFLRDVFHAGQVVALYGKVEETGGGLQITSPQYEIVGEAGDGDEAAAQAGDYTRIVPIYERIGTLTPKIQRALVQQAIEALPRDLPDPLPDSVRARRHLPDRVTALRDTHLPPDTASIADLNAFRTPAQVRLIFEEFLLFQAGVLLRRQDRAAERKPYVCAVDDRIREAARALLPFRLTPGQKAATRAIVEDMQKPEPMNRLLQGDVGSGKTIVAALAALVALENGLQVAFMAPTEILADQHAMTLRRLFAGTRFVVAALTGRQAETERRRVQAGLSDGAIGLAVGTHALVQEGVSFARLGLVIIDEQHRFGVVQRSLLRAKGGTPDVLVMTATPIPRTLALTTYGDLDVTVIPDRPIGRQPVRTTVRPESRREEVWEFVRGEVGAGRQAYVIYPLVEESEKIDVRDATAMADQLAQEVFPEFTIGLLHGRLASDAKERVMAAFASGEIDVLVATTVVEVGVDVPNATVMVIEHAERFGLSQLHQLRGRVGRGDAQAHCVLLYQPPLSDEARERLQAIAATADGFALAEKDLELRGPGDFFGTRQAGLPTLRIGDLVRDRALLIEARDEAARWIAEAPAGDARLRAAREGWADRFGLVDVG